jgi:methyltransferase (TIGR00027 family)
METERPDAIFKDPFARQLAGPEGKAIVAALPRGQSTAWALIIRTAVFDEMILASIQTRGVQRILNLAAGLDARPWRLAVPPTLEWIDVDLPAMLEYKTQTLGDVRPVCRYRAMPADLTNAGDRAALFSEVGGSSPPTLVITEGLLIYLTNEQVAALARDLRAQPSLQWWLLDIASPVLLRHMEKYWGTALRAGRAPFQFGPAEGTKFFEPFGWREVEFRSASDEARRLKRQMRGAWFWQLLARFSPPEKQEQYRRMSGFVLFGRV